MPKTEVAQKQADLPVVLSTGQLIASALDRLADAGENAPHMVEALEKLMGLKEREEDRQAERDFNAALARFQKTCPQIPRERVASVTSRKSGMTSSYRYADLQTILKYVNEPLHAEGFAYTWDTVQEQGRVVTTCRLSHEGGHSRSATFSSPIDDRNPMQSGPQKEGGALTYARRQSFVQVTGLVMCDPDDDAQICGETISENQAADLHAMMTEVGADEPRFLKYMGVRSIEDITVDDFQKAIAALEAKRRKGE